MEFTNDWWSAKFNSDASDDQSAQPKSQASGGVASGKKMSLEGGEPQLRVGEGEGTLDGTQDGAQDGAHDGAALGDTDGAKLGA